MTAGGGFFTESQFRQRILEILRLQTEFSADAVINDLIGQFGEDTVVGSYNINHNDDLLHVIFEIRNSHYEFLSTDEDSSKDNDDTKPDDEEETSDQNQVHTKFYRILGLSPTATQNQLTRSYKKLALQYHPDKNPYGEEKFKEISMVYKVLSDPEKRLIYDLQGEAGIKAGSGDEPASETEKPKDEDCFSDSNLSDLIEDSPDQKDSNDDNNEEPITEIESSSTKDAENDEVKDKNNEEYEIEVNIEEKQSKLDESYLSVVNEVIAEDLDQIDKNDSSDTDEKPSDTIKSAKRKSKENQDSNDDFSVEKDQSENAENKSDDPDFEISEETSNSGGLKKVKKHVDSSKYKGSQKKKYVPPEENSDSENQDKNPKKLKKSKKHSANASSSSQDSDSDQDKNPKKLQKKKGKKGFSTKKGNKYSDSSSDSSSDESSESNSSDAGNSDSSDSEPEPKQKQSQKINSGTVRKGDKGKKVHYNDTEHYWLKKGIKDLRKSNKVLSAENIRKSNSKYFKLLMSGEGNGKVKRTPESIASKIRHKGKRWYEAPDHKEECKKLKKEVKSLKATIAKIKRQMNELKTENIMLKNKDKIEDKEKDPEQDNESDNSRKHSDSDTEDDNFQEGIRSETISIIETSSSNNNNNGQSDKPDDDGNSDMLDTSYHNENSAEAGLEESNVNTTNKSDNPKLRECYVRVKKLTKQEIEANCKKPQKKAASSENKKADSNNNNKRKMEKEKADPKKQKMSGKKSENNNPVFNPSPGSSSTFVSSSFKIPKHKSNESDPKPKSSSKHQAKDREVSEPTPGPSRSEFNLSDQVFKDKSKKAKKNDKKHKKDDKDKK